MREALVEEIIELPGEDPCPGDSLNSLSKPEQQTSSALCYYNSTTLYPALKLLNPAAMLRSLYWCENGKVGCIFHLVPFHPAAGRGPDSLSFKVCRGWLTASLGVDSSTTGGGCDVGCRG
jgi:hypothetical protein